MYVWVGNILGLCRFRVWDCNSKRIFRVAHLDADLNISNLNPTPKMFRSNLTLKIIPNLNSTLANPNPEVLE